MSSASREPPFRAEHLGSLLRPSKLLKKRQAIHQKQDTSDGLRQLEEDSIREIVQIQTDCGFRGISDGEYVRHMFWGTFFPTLNGMKEISGPDLSLSIFREYVPDIAAFLEEDKVPGESVICVGKISHTGKSSYIEQFEFLKSIVPKERHGDIKMTLAAPNWYHLRYKEGKAYPKEVYGSDEEYFKDIAEAYRTELKILYEAGLRNAQVDDPNLAYFCSEKMIEGWKKDTANTQSIDDLFDAYIRFYNQCFERPADMHLGIHLCRGNFVNSRHFSEGGYDRIARKLFQELNVSTYYLEYDTSRAGGFEPLKELPKNKNVILGVITSKFPKLEDKEEMKERIYKAAEIVAAGSGESKEDALQRLGVSPQCGFASHEDGNLLSHDDMVKKLKLVRQIADEVWLGQP
ncbi:hypothetical protein LTR91_014132 [Friedmanniomyces endolithicus]|uniref:Cobalamin-independent methionine synthase MetE C-terminal/archaeal domain-containing protein n=1 Tax=Friedmanniomyces endolithicus TaxID=329885 RepID=A0AAN6KCC2_9PEZI|nr:hypothetical protein LTR94_007439 [Friedmanniomyces endolithicus]KAK0789975.1 hypothetical protein LTR59_009445 [Friedmanniomyces endolithicus]KAK0796116.1 hypothetical protein LTR38_008611 [Friedmanniomyces endolithicus]KAK0855616.1 hypothetical protein LTR03_001716 [Friedmanniomyces endolithicus]KAK0862847.1 hypothetical protein LTS02_006936 [Friedmanniomyces endolithicus]